MPPPAYYYRVRGGDAVRPTAEVFQQLGFVSALTTLSCLLVRTRIVDFETFQGLHALPGIYSHTFAMRCWLQDRYVGVADHPCILRMERPPDAIATSINAGLVAGNHELFPWTVGLWRLATSAAKLLQTSPTDLLGAYEAEVSLSGKDAPRVVRGTTRTVLRRFWVDLLMSSSSVGQHGALEELMGDTEFLVAMGQASLDPVFSYPSPVTFDPARWSM